MSTEPTEVWCSDCRWERASQATAARQQKLEESATQLATFQAAEAQLRPWLMEKELMMSVLGPLSIDPNMLNAQKQQVQVSAWSRRGVQGWACLVSPLSPNPTEPKVL